MDWIMADNSPHTQFVVPLGPGRSLRLGRHPLVMGILNVTPDSFSDGGDFNLLDQSIAHAYAMIAHGADIIDVGGESTRPGAEEMPVQAELDRVMPVFDALRTAETQTPLSIDTYKALVADQAVQAGAAIINDVHGLQREPEMADVAVLHNVPVVAMHWDVERDTSRDLISEVARYFERTIQIAVNAGLPGDQLILDPGFGFGKTLPENYELLRRLHELTTLGYPLLVGTSRKSMIGKLLGNEPKERLAGTIATNVHAYSAGAHIFRVHDVRPNAEALRVAAATLYGPAHTET
jgi:dihydropteroate synthase